MKGIGTWWLYVVLVGLLILGIFLLILMSFKTGFLAEALQIIRETFSLDRLFGWFSGNV